MKVAIVSDMHLGYERFYDDAYKQAREAFEAIAEEGADMVIIPGDIFDKRNPKPDVIAQAINLFRDFSRKQWPAELDKFMPLRNGKVYTGIPVVAIPGTHERVAEGKENPLTLLGLAGLLIDASESIVAFVYCRAVCPSRTRMPSACAGDYIRKGFHYRPQVYAVPLVERWPEP